MADQSFTPKESYVGNAIRSLYQMIVIIDEESSTCQVIDCNKELANIGIRDGDPASILYQNVLKNINPKDREDFVNFFSREYIQDVLSREVHIYAECRIRHSNSKYYWSRITICNAKVEDSPEGQEYLFLIQDIHGQKSREVRAVSKMQREFCELSAKYDSLFIENMTDIQTGCFNRKGLQYYEGIFLKEAKEPSKRLFVCVLDLNGLKYLNDTFGHPAGDEALKAVSDAFKASVPEGSKIIRTGGDEFLALNALDALSSQPQEMGAKIEKWLEEYNASHDNPFTVAASYGYVFEDIGEGVENIDEYVEEADKRMYEMKVRTDRHMR